MIHSTLGIRQPVVSVSRVFGVSQIHAMRQHVLCDLLGSNWRCQGPKQQAAVESLFPAYGLGRYYLEHTGSYKILPG